MKLEEKEREELNQVHPSWEVVCKEFNLLRILLLADGGQSDAEIIDALKASRTTIVRIRKRYFEGGLESALNERSRSGAPASQTTFHRSDRIACSDPPEGRSRWTLNRLADKLVELGEVDSISGMTVCRALKKMK